MRRVKIKGRFLREPAFCVEESKGEAAERRSKIRVTTYDGPGAERQHLVAPVAQGRSAP